MKHMTSYRRTNKQRGFVNFPTDSKTYKSSGEGGIYVELWAIPKDDRDWGLCCGPGGVYAAYSGTLLGTDNKINSDNWDEIEKALRSDRHAPSHLPPQRFELEEEFFPQLRSASPNYSSIPLLACISLGSTGWSGYCDDKGYWRCRYEDLTEGGKQIYDALDKLYGTMTKLSLVTWLDT